MFYQQLPFVNKNFQNVAKANYYGDFGHNTWISFSNFSGWHPSSWNVYYLFYHYSPTNFRQMTMTTKTTIPSRNTYPNLKQIYIFVSEWYTIVTHFQFSRFLELRISIKALFCRQNFRHKGDEYTYVTYTKKEKGLSVYCTSIMQFFYPRVATYPTTLNDRPIR